MIKPLSLTILLFVISAFAILNQNLVQASTKKEIISKQKIEFAWQTNSETIANKNAAQQAVVPDAVVRELYKVHRPDKSILGSKSRALFDKFFDKNLADLIWKDLTTHPGEIGVIDFDLFYNAQDISIKNLLIGRPKTLNDRATIPVSFMNYNQRTLLMYVLAKQNGAWKISDIRHDAKNSLLKYFQEAAK